MNNRYLAHFRRTGEYRWVVRTRASRRDKGTTTGRNPCRAVEPPRYTQFDIHIPRTWFNIFQDSVIVNMRRKRYEERWYGLQNPKQPSFIHYCPEPLTWLGERFRR